MSIANQIFEGDCVQVLPRFPAASVDLIVTDPPYLIAYRDRAGRSIANDDKPDGVLSAFSDLYRVLKDDSLCVTFYGWAKVELFAKAWREAGFRPVGHLVWPKPYASSRGMLESRHEQAFVLAKGYPQKPIKPLPDVLPREYTGNRQHPTEKAVSVIRPLIDCFSRPGDLVLDPFAGSGSTLVAACLSGRSYVGIELEDKYCRLARRRLAGAQSYVEAREAA